MKTFLCALLALLSALMGMGFAENDAVVPADIFPADYYKPAAHAGKVEMIQYPSRDYAGDQSETTKSAIVYLPYGYDENERYDVLVLCHGIGGTENEWGFRNQYCVGRYAVDHLIEDGLIAPLIVVCPNGRASANCYDTSMNNAASFYVFGQELRNDLLPYIDAHYATYGSDTPEDPAASRLHRAMAGLSMGGMQTINIGLCECLDLFSAFGAFSAAPTSYTAQKTAQQLEQYPDCDIRYFYSICGLQDGTAYASAAAAAKGLPDYTSRLDQNNWYWHEVNGVHNFTVWNLGLYNFLIMLGSAEQG